MKKFAALLALATAVSFTTVSAQADGWGKGGHRQSSGGLLNVSPSIQTGNLKLLSGIGVLNNSSILSGNVLSGIVKGNNNNVGHGNVSGRQNAVGNGFIGGGSFGNSKSYSSKRFGKRW
ncbi:hypothetical protein [Mesorhizobium sp. CAU 1741]|uniref:hypothetical protein n=1 Tax=Mesorhizobium sp. CAU 1741 TaxID=3140366 RepID=UPI00325BF56C